MKRRRHLIARLDRLCPPSVSGGVLFIEDIESGAARLDELPRGRGGYLLLHRPCATVEQWTQRHGGVRPAAPNIIA